MCSMYIRENRYLCGNNALERTLVALVVPDVDACVKILTKGEEHNLIFRNILQGCVRYGTVFSVPV